MALWAFLAAVKSTTERVTERATQWGKARRLRRRLEAMAGER